MRPDEKKPSISELLEEKKPEGGDSSEQEDRYLKELKNVRRLVALINPLLVVRAEPEQGSGDGGSCVKLIISKRAANGYSSAEDITSIYLTKHLAPGKTEPGFVLGQLSYTQDELETEIRKVLPLSRQ